MSTGINLIEHIQDMISSDDCNRTKESIKLQHFYENQDVRGKELLDTAFIYLCGYSLETLISEV